MERTPARRDAGSSTAAGTGLTSTKHVTFTGVRRTAGSASYDDALPPHQPTFTDIDFESAPPRDVTGADAGDDRLSMSQLQQTPLPGMARSFVSWDASPAADRRTPLTRGSVRQRSRGPSSSLRTSVLRNTGASYSNDEFAEHGLESGVIQNNGAQSSIFKEPTRARRNWCSRLMKLFI